jgi:hypothetical protein
MTRSPLTAGAADAPTPFTDLNTLLADWLAGVHERLGDNLVGAYLQGSFALGDPSEGSDCDFIVALKRDLTKEEANTLEALHADLRARPTPWGGRMEGSYAPAEILRRLTAEPRDAPGETRPASWKDPEMDGSPPRHYPFWFIGNGKTGLVRSEHDNSHVVRWVTREKGVVLAGPPPAELIDPVPPEALRAEIRGTMRRLTPVLTADPRKIDQRWLQAFYVTLYARMLHTLQTGEVKSKSAAADWAIANLEPRWRPLIEASDALRKLPPEQRLDAADRTAVAETLAFMRHALRLDARWIEEKAKAARLDPSHAPGGKGGKPNWANQGARGPRGSVAPPSRPLGGGRRV